MRLKRTGVREIQKPEDLSETTLAIIGLFNMGVFNALPLICKSTEKNIDEYVDLILEVQMSEEPVVQECIRNGLPQGLSAALDTDAYVRCPLCNHNVNMVPCPYCNSTKKERPAAEVRPGRRKQPQPTDAKPGSRSKVDVLAERFARGEHLHHKLDKKL